MSVSKRKTFELIRATGSRLKSGDVLEVGGRRVKINRQGTARVNDAVLARDLLDKYGRKSLNRGTAGQLLGAELETYNQERHADPVRRTVYHTIPALPWATYDELGKRIH